MNSETKNIGLQNEDYFVNYTPTGNTTGKKANQPIAPEEPFFENMNVNLEEAKAADYLRSDAPVISL